MVNIQPFHPLPQLVQATTIIPNYSNIFFLLHVQFLLHRNPVNIISCPSFY